MKKNEHFITTIEDMSEDGAGVGKTDGFIWFIKDTVIGDVVEASAMKMKKSYGYARLVKVLTPSPYRVEPKCPVARLHVPTNDFEDMVLESDVSAVMDVPPEGSINNVFEYCFASD